MSKVNSEILENAVRDILAYSKGEKIVHNGEERTGKKRKFTESVELQISKFQSTLMFVWLRFEMANSFRLVRLHQRLLMCVYIHQEASKNACTYTQQQQKPRSNFLQPLKILTQPRTSALVAPTGSRFHRRPA